MTNSLRSMTISISRRSIRWRSHFDNPNHTPTSRRISKNVLRNSKLLLEILRLFLDMSMNSWIILKQFVESIKHVLESQRNLWEILSCVWICLIRRLVGVWLGLSKWNRHRIDRIEIVIESIELEIVVNSIEFEIVVIVVNAMDFEIDRVGNRSQSTSKRLKRKR